MSPILAFLVLICFWYFIITIITKLMKFILTKVFSKPAKNSSDYYNAITQLNARLMLVIKEFPKDKSDKELLETEPFKTVFLTVNKLLCKSISHKWLIFQDPIKKFYSEFGEQLKVISKLPGWTNEEVNTEEIFNSIGDK